MAKVYDVVATTGTYVKDGVTKYLSKNVGEVIDTKHGLAMKIDATFNPAGCTKTDDGKVWLKLFEPRESGQQSGQGRAPAQSAPASGGFESDFEDSLPF
jgi:hypothetical protein